MQTLPRQIVRVVSAFSGGPRPVGEGAAHALAHLFLLLVESLLGGLLPREMQIPDGGNHAQPDRAARREPDRLFPFGRIMRSQVGLRGTVGEMARGEHVRHPGPERRGGQARFGEVDIDEVAVAPGKFCEGMQALHDAGALGPAAAYACRIGDHAHFAAAERGFTGRQHGGVGAAGFEQFLRGHVLDARVGRQPIHGQPDASAPQISANLLVLGPIETVLLEQGRKAIGAPRGLASRGQQAVEQARQRGGKLGPAAGGAGEALQVVALTGRQLARLAP